VDRLFISLLDVAAPGKDVFFVSGNALYDFVFSNEKPLFWVSNIR
jgi:hypothetical protein